MRAPHEILVELDERGWAVISDSASLCYGTGRTLSAAQRDYRKALRELVEACDGEVLGLRLAGRVQAAKEQLAAAGSPSGDGPERLDP